MMRIYLILMILFFFQGACAQDLAWPAVKKLVRSNFPSVAQLSTDSLAAYLATPEADLLLLDVREAEEYAVSHLPGAVRIDPGRTNLADFDSLAKDKPVVLYCSVGYRSSEMAQRFQEAGFTNVASLDGSIFQWANEDRPVYRDGAEVRQVHPFDKTWGLLLKKPLRAYSPEP